MPFEKIKNIISSLIFKARISLGPWHFGSLKLVLSRFYIEIYLLIFLVVPTVQFFLVFENLLEIIVLRLGRKPIFLSTE
jgi:hypothetical protein